MRERVTEKDGERQIDRWIDRQIEKEREIQSKKRMKQQRQGDNKITIINKGATQLIDVLKANDDKGRAQASEEEVRTECRNERTLILRVNPFIPIVH